MQTRLVLLSLCACTLAFADQVVLKNGDTITGSVVKKDGANLTFKSQFLGAVTIPWSAIKSLKSDQELTVILSGGEAVKGKIETSGDTLGIAAAGGAMTAPLATVTILRDADEEAAWEKQQHPSLLQAWDATYNLGLALARGNARTTNLTNTVTAVRSTAKDKITVNFNEIYATALVNGVNAASASQILASWAYNRNVTPRFFWATTNAYDHDRFQDLDIRMVFGGGGGWNAVKTDNLNFSLQGGGDFEREQFSNDGPTVPAFDRNSAEANVADNLTYKVSSNTSFTESFQFFPNLTYTGNYRFNFNVSAVTSIKKWLGWHVTFNDNYLSNPILGRLRNDVILSTGFQVHASNK